MKNFNDGQAVAFLGNSFCVTGFPLTFSVRVLSSNRLGFMVEGLFQQIQWNMSAMIDYYSGSRINLSLEWPL